MLYGIHQKTCPRIYQTDTCDGYSNYICRSVQRRLKATGLGELPRIQISRTRHDCLMHTQHWPCQPVGENRSLKLPDDPKIRRRAKTDDGAAGVSFTRQTSCSLFPPITPLVTLFCCPSPFHSFPLLSSVFTSSSVFLSSDFSLRPSIGSTGSRTEPVAYSPDPRRQRVGLQPPR